jgi:PAS domain S-box-containing protein
MMSSSLEMKTGKRIDRLNRLKGKLLGNYSLDTKLKYMTDEVVELFDAEFARIWITRKGDLCDSSCVYAKVSRGSHFCSNHIECLHLFASSGRYTHLNGKLHRRIPMGCLKIGNLATGQDSAFVINDVVNDKRIQDPKWAKELGLVSFAGFKIVAMENKAIGVLALFSKHILDDDDLAILETISSTASQVIQTMTALEELRESEKKFRSLVDNMGEGVGVVDPDENFIFVNPMAEEIFGVDAEHIIGHSLNDFTTPEQYDMIRSQTAKRKNGTQSRYQLKIKRPDGDERYIFVTARPEFDSKGNMIDILGIFHDITEQKKLEEQLNQSQKLEGIGQLAGGIAHDFNNILTVIYGSAEMALRRLDQNSRPARDIRQVIKSSEKAENLVRQLLAFSRKQIIKPKVLDINESILNLQKMLGRVIGEDINIKLSLTKDITPIMADPSQLEQVLINLMVNARDAINQKTDLASGKRITLKTEQVNLDQDFIASHVGSAAGQYILISVTDNGIGMDEHTRKKIFEPFFTTKEVGKGTGLGLSTVYGIVKQNKGCIYAYSEPGVGTVFKIFWPIEESTVTEMPKVKVVEAARGGDEIILLVEDDDHLKDMTAETLIDFGYTVYKASNGVKALELIKKEKIRPHILVTDMIMPEMNGKELAIKLKSIFSGIKILFCSGYSDETVIPQGSPGRELHFLAKPYSINILTRKIRYILDQP